VRDPDICRRCGRTVPSCTRYSHSNSNAKWAHRPPQPHMPIGNKWAPLLWDLISCHEATIRATWIASRPRAHAHARERYYFRGKLYLTRVIRGYLLLEFVAVGCGYLLSPIAPALFFALISDTWADCTVCILESAPDILSPCLLSASVHRLPLSPFLLVQVR